MKKLLLILTFPILASGCTYAGPYVTNVSSDGDYGLNVEKCMVKLNAFTGTISNHECTSQQIRLNRRY